jgi:hypothetical protein
MLVLLLRLALFAHVWSTADVVGVDALSSVFGIATTDSIRYVSCSVSVLDGSLVMSSQQDLPFNERYFAIASEEEEELAAVRLICIDAETQNTLTPFPPIVALNTTSIHHASTIHLRDAEREERELQANRDSPWSAATSQLGLSLGKQSVWMSFSLRMFSLLTLFAAVLTSFWVNSNPSK